MKYTTEPYGFNLMQILEDGKPLCLASSENRAKIIAALKLYDVLKQEFSPILEKTYNFDEYIGLGSSWIVKLGYDRENKLMKVVKRESSIAPEVVMIYKDVPKDVFNCVVKPSIGSSVGAAYNKLIRGKFTLISQNGLEIV